MLAAYALLFVGLVGVITAVLDITLVSWKLAVDEDVRHDGLDTLVLVVGYPFGLAGLVIGGLCMAVAMDAIWGIW